jgi:hypothetical protein
VIILGLNAFHCRFVRSAFVLIFPTFARHLLSGAHAVSRFSALWRRIQGDGTRTVRPTLIPDATRKIVRLLPDGGFELDLKFFRHHREDVSYQWADGSPEFGDLFSPVLEQLLEPRRLQADPLEERHRDIARSLQAVYEEAFFPSPRDPITCRLRPRRRIGLQ